MYNNRDLTVLVKPSGLMLCFFFSSGFGPVFEQCTRCLRYRRGTTGTGTLGASLGAQTYHSRRHDETVAAGKGSARQTIKGLAFRLINDVESSSWFFFIRKCTCALIVSVTGQNSNQEIFKRIFNIFFPYLTHKCFTPSIKTLCTNNFS